MPIETGSISQMLFVIRYLHDRMLELGLCMRGAVTIGGMYWNDRWSNPVNRGGHIDAETEVLYERGREQDFWVTLGPGLIEAYTLESDCAIYPRILISQSLYEHVDSNNYWCSPVGPYQPPDRPLTDFFRKDADGWNFLDLLHPDITRSDTERIVRSETDDGKFSIEWQRDGNTHAKMLNYVNRAIKTGLTTSEKVRAKYQWLQTYRNLIREGSCCE